MENNHDNNENKLSNNINDVVDEILGTKPTGPEHTNIEIVAEDVKRATPPPIPATNNVPPPPPPIPTVKHNEPVNKSTNNDDFLKQVLNVVDHDIDAQPVDLSAIDEIIKQDQPRQPSHQVTKNDALYEGYVSKPIETVKVSETVEYEKPIDGMFFREDDLKLENYHHNLRIEKENPFKMEEIDRELNQKNIELIEKKFATIIEAKNDNINRLVDKNKELEEKCEISKIDYAKQFESFYKRENQQLEDLKDKYQILLSSKEELEKSLYDFQLKELQQEQDKILAEKDALILERRKLEEERIKKEEQERLQRLQEEEKERARQEQLHLERMKAEREALDKQKAIIESLIAEQKRIQEENLREQEELLRKAQEQEAQAQAKAQQRTHLHSVAARSSANNKNQVMSLSQLRANGNKQNGAPSRKLICK